MGYNIGDTPTNEIPGINLDSYYTLSGSTVTKGQVVLIVFADPINDSATYVSYLKNVQTVISAYQSSNITVIGVLYQYNGELDVATYLSYCDTLTAAGITFTIVNNGAWANSAAFNYMQVGISSTPYIYLTSKNYLITSKNPSDLSATVATLMAGPSILALDPASASTLNALSAMSVTFSEAVTGGATKGNYTLGGAGKGTLSVSSANADGTTANKYNLALAGSPSDGALEVAIANIADTVFYTPVALADTTVDYTGDVTGPAIASSFLASDNSYISVTFDEKVYSTAGGSGILDAGDFTVTFAKKTGQASNAVISNVSSEADGLTVHLYLTFTGTPSGVEQITVNAAANSIYDALGNISATSVKTSTFTLIDQYAPVAELSTLPFVNTNQTSASITVGGDDVVAYRYKLDSGAYLSETAATNKIALSGLSNATHTLYVIGKDTAGNWQDQATPTTHSWTVNTVAPKLNTGGTLDAGNASIVISFDNGVYAAYDSATGVASGALTAADFLLTFVQNGGNVTTASISGVTHTAGEAQLTLGLYEDQYASGVETIEITPVASSVYDIYGNTVSATETTGVVKLNDRVAPTATITNAPATPNKNTAYSITIAGDDVVKYSYSIDDKATWSADTAVSTPISLSLTTSKEYTLYVIGIDAAGNRQEVSSATSCTWTIDLSAPVLQSSLVATDNTQVTVFFSEPVYAAADGTGNLTAASFKFTKSGGVATVVFGNVTHVAGETSAIVDITVSGTDANGSESIIITPASGASIYDKAGNPALGTSSVSANLFNKTAPVVSSVTISNNSTPFTSAFTYNIVATGTSNIGWYKVTETSAKPDASDTDWKSVSTPSKSVNVTDTYLPVYSGVRNLFAWVKDSADNVNGATSNSYNTFTFKGKAYVMLRDNVKDVGTVPVDVNNGLSTSLDVSIQLLDVGPETIRTATYSDYVGEGSSLAKNTNYFIYLRATNLSSAAVSDAVGYVYYSIGGVTNNGWMNNPLFLSGTTTKANPITNMSAYNAADATLSYVGATKSGFLLNLPSAGHNCFIGIVSTPEHPWDPNFLPKFDVSLFQQFIKYSPNVCWRNFDIRDTTTVKSTFTRKDALVNEWKEDVPVMVGVTVRKIPVGTRVDIVNDILKIKVTKVLDKTDDLIYTPGAVLKAGVKTDLVTTLTLPSGQKLVNGSQLEASAFMGVQKEAKPAVPMVKMQAAVLKTPSVMSAVSVAQKEIAKTADVDEVTDIPVGFVKMGSYTTLFSDPAVKEEPALDTSPVTPVIQKTDIVTPSVKLGAPSVKSVSPIRAFVNKLTGAGKPKPAPAKKPGASKPSVRTRGSASGALAKKAAPKKAVKSKTPAKAKPGKLKVIWTNEKSSSSKKPVKTQSRVTSKKAAASSKRSGKPSKAKSTKKK